MKYTISVRYMRLRQKVFGFFLLGALTSAHCSFGQFWFGPKIGGNIIANVYDDDDFKKAYDVPINVNFNAGISMDYETEGMFLVHSEVTYERVKNRVSSTSEDQAFFDIRSTYHFISMPVMARMVIGDIRKPLKFYLQAGPRLKVWLAGSGEARAEEYLEYGLVDDINTTIPFDVAFGVDPEDRGNRQYIVQEANRIQYSLDFGGGGFLDLRNGQRVNIDVRLSWGHSNMGFNVDGDDLALDGFDDDLKYHHNMLNISAAYLFGYDPTALKKGKSTQGGRKAN